MKIEKPMRAQWKRAHGHVADGISWVEGERPQSCAPIDGGASNFPTLAGGCVDEKESVPSALATDELFAAVDDPLRNGLPIFDVVHVGSELGVVPQTN